MKAKNLKTINESVNGVQTPSINLNIKKIPIRKGQYLTDILLEIPTNCILDKTICGLGATHSELIAKRNSIIIEPNVPVIKGKTEKYKGIRLGVYDGVQERTIKKYLSNKNIKYKKILCTPENYLKVRRLAKDIDENLLYDKYFCLCDECEKMTQDIDYRVSIDLPMIDFFRYKGKAFVSATPLEIRNPEFKKHNFFKLKIIPKFNYLKNIHLIVTNRYNDRVTQKLNELANSKCVCVFLNSTNGINKLVTYLKGNGIIDYKVFCSKKSVYKFEDRAITESFEDLNLPLAKYNFFTSRFFSAVDINIDIKPDILILTDLWEATHTEIDPYTSAIQLCGRFRIKTGEQNFNSITHITNVGYYNEQMLLTEQDIDVYIDEAQKNYNLLDEKLKQATEKGRIRLLENDKKKLIYNRFVDTDEETNKTYTNYFAIDNFYDDYRVKSYYLTPERLANAYLATKHFKPSLEIHIEAVGEDSSLYYAKLRTNKECRQHIVANLEILIKEFGANSDKVAYAKSQFKREDDYKKSDNADYIIKAIEKLGCKVLKTTNCTDREINELLAKHQKAANLEKRFAPEVKQAIKDKYPKGEYIKTDVIAEIQKIYDYNGIDEKVTYSGEFGVERYFCCDVLKGKNKKGMIYIHRFAPDDERQEYNWDDEYEVYKRQYME